MISDPMVGVFDASSRARSLRRNSTKRSFAVRLLYFDFFDTFRFTKPEKVLSLGHTLQVRVSNDKQGWRSDREHFFRDFDGLYKF